jgi:hypothetical protein
LESGYFPITQTFGSFAICIDEADIARCIGETAADSSDAIAASQRRCSASMQQFEV